MAHAAPDFASRYGQWLISRLTQSVRDGVVEVSTPLLDPLNDGMRVYVETTPAGMVIHDRGLTLETLSLYGVEIDSSPRRRMLVDKMLRSSGVALEGERIQTTANDNNLPQRMHFLLSAMHRISDLWLTARPAGTVDFFERVCSYLDEKEVLYSTNLSIPGRTVEHPIDIVIPLPRRQERLIRLIGTPNTNTAKIVSFSWIEIADVRPDSERIILINDEAPGDSDEIRTVSQQTESILRGYSTAMYRWSNRESEDFSSFWKAA